jgi:hypothetical protein
MKKRVVVKFGVLQDAEYIGEDLEKVDVSDIQNDWSEYSENVRVEDEKHIYLHSTFQRHPELKDKNCDEYMIRCITDRGMQVCRYDKAEIITQPVQDVLVDMLSGTMKDGEEADFHLIEWKDIVSNTIGHSYICLSDVKVFKFIDGSVKDEIDDGYYVFNSLKSCLEWCGWSEDMISENDCIGELLENKFYKGSGKILVVSVKDYECKRIFRN